MEDARDLILQAFRQAWSSNKPDWYRMTTPVLKNRILALTDGRFTEARYGARSLTDFVTKFDDLITLDGSRIPPIVELRDQERIHVTPSELERGPRPPRIRSDLWRATLDYASGQGVRLGRKRESSATTRTR